MPVDVAGETIAILAKRGAGKTNTATVLVEELIDANVQTVIIDPVGAWWGIRSSAEGERGAGLRVPILGGQHGDVPLEQTAGALIADVVVDSGQSLLLDLSDFPSKAASNRFVTDFAERLYRRKARSGSLLHVVLEEADEFAPQKGQADTARMRGAIEAIVRRGRSRGLGVTLITQRSAVLNKDVLTQADVLIVMRTTGPHDVKAIKEWVAARGDEHGETVIESLPSLMTGEAWVWNPERSILERVRIRRRRTFDSSATPKAGEIRAVPTSTAEIDIAALGERIQETADRARENDPAELRKRIRELEQKAVATREPERVEVRVEVPVLNGEVDALRDAVSALQSTAADVLESAAAIAGELNKWTGVAVERPKPLAVPAVPTRRPPALVPPDGRQRYGEGVALPKVERLILAALAPYGQRTLTQVAMLAGYAKNGGGFRNGVSSCRTKGLVEGNDPLSITQKGCEALGRWEPLPTGPALFQHWLNHPKVKKAEAEILTVLVEAAGVPLTAEEIADRTPSQYASGGGGFRNALSALRTLELVHGYKTMTANEELL